MLEIEMVIVAIVSENKNKELLFAELLFNTFKI
jgi:hypothetical protein